LRALDPHAENPTIGDDLVLSGTKVKSRLFALLVIAVIAETVADAEHPVGITTAKPTEPRIDRNQRMTPATMVPPSLESDFPEVTVSVAPITQRSRAILAKTHHRPGTIVDFSAIFGDR
jgi:hypothetical protein